jgi:hypothetical protein
VGSSAGSSAGVLASSSTRLSTSGGKPVGGRAGRDFSTMSDWSSFFLAAALVFFLRRAMRDSWQLMQKMPCEVRAYRRFSIFRLQLRQRKQVAQKAWSPVRIARSSILLPQALQL